MINSEIIQRLEERVKKLEQSLTPSWAQGVYKYSEPEPEPKKTVRQWLEELPAEQYNAGFYFDSNGDQYLRLPDGSMLLYVKPHNRWAKVSGFAESNPHTLTEVTKYTVGKFYHLDGDKNHYGNYGLCAKVEKDVILMRAINVSGVIAMSVTLARHDDNDIVEVTPVS